jgi:hypothetical protein
MRCLAVLSLCAHCALAVFSLCSSQGYAEVIGPAFHKCVQGGGEVALRIGLEVVMTIIDEKASTQKAVVDVVDVVAVLAGLV